MAETRNNLGRGLAALFGEESEDYAALDKVRTTKEVRVEQIDQACVRELPPNLFRSAARSNTERRSELLDRCSCTRHFNQVCPEFLSGELVQVRKEVRPDNTFALFRQCLAHLSLPFVGRHAHEPSHVVVALEGQPRFRQELELDRE